LTLVTIPVTKTIILASETDLTSSKETMPEFVESRPHEVLLAAVIEERALPRGLMSTTLADVVGAREDGIECQEEDGQYPYGGLPEAIAHFRTRLGENGQR
jgi:hypothetical protein